MVQGFTFDSYGLLEVEFEKNQFKKNEAKVVNVNTGAIEKVNTTYSLCMYYACAYVLRKFVTTVNPQLSNRLCTFSF